MISIISGAPLQNLKILRRIGPLVSNFVVNFRAMFDDRPPRHAVLLPLRKILPVVITASTATIVSDHHRVVGMLQRGSHDDRNRFAEQVV
jgi:hypothetical protein